MTFSLPNRNYVCTLLSCAFLLSTLAACSQNTTSAGLSETHAIQGQERGGGDAKAIRSAILDNQRESLIQKSIALFEGTSNSRIEGALYWIVAHKNMNFKNSKHQEMLNTMIEKGFAQDISSLKFVRSSKCLDSNGADKTAVASMNVPRSSICINVEKFVNEFGPYIQDSDVLGLVMHELAHHYGYEDADHGFAAAVANVWQSDNERRSEDGEPLNYFIK